MESTEPTNEKRELSLHTSYRLLRVKSTTLNQDQSVVFRNEKGNDWDTYEPECNFKTTEEALRYAKSNSKWNNIDFVILTVYKWAY